MTWHIEVKMVRSSGHGEAFKDIAADPLIVYDAPSLEAISCRFDLLVREFTERGDLSEFNEVEAGD